jgi:glycosyltransferase involved in cell wall biosynthesis
MHFRDPAPVAVAKFADLDRETSVTQEFTTDLPSSGGSRVLLVSSHVIQYAAPVFRLMGQRSDLDILVAYCSLQGVEPGPDPEFNVQVKWDVPLLEGYPWKHIPNRSPCPRLGQFFGLINTGLWSLVRKGKFDAVVVYGYAYLSFWIAILAAKSAGVPLILATDSVRLYSPRQGWWWKRWLKQPIVRFIYRRVADIVLVPSTATRQFIQSLGVPDDRIAFSHYTVDNRYFEQGAAGVDRNAVRRSWGIPPDAFVILFCAKLAPWKRPQDLLAAFAAAQNGGGAALPTPYLVFAGEGSLRSRLETEARALGVEDRVRFLGFVNQSKLSEVYCASDVLVLPSAHEPWGLVVNEAMACGLPVVVSDRVGARLDLVIHGETGEVYPVGDVQSLARTLRTLLSDCAQMKRMGAAARKRIETWSYRESLEGFVEAVEKAVRK